MNKSVILIFNDANEPMGMMLENYPPCTCGCDAEQHSYSTRVHVQPNSRNLVSKVEVNISYCCNHGCKRGCMEYKENYTSPKP